MAIEIQAPMPYHQFEQVKIFLAGSIEMGVAEPWQQRVVSALADLNVVILNPRRNDWDPSWKQDQSDPRFVEQVNWELVALDDSNIVVVYFDPNTKSPISLLELGLHVRLKGVLVCCPENFYRFGNVSITCQKYKVPVFVDLGKLIAVLRQTIQTATISKTLAQPETQIAADPADIMDSQDAPDLDEVRPKSSPVQDPEQSKAEFQAFLASAQDIGESKELRENWLSDAKRKLGDKFVTVVDKIMGEYGSNKAADYNSILEKHGFTIDRMPGEQFPGLRYFTNGDQHIMVGPGGWMVCVPDIRDAPINGRSVSTLETYLEAAKDKRIHARFNKTFQAGLNTLTPGSKPGSKIDESKDYPAKPTPTGKKKKKGK